MAAFSKVAESRDRVSGRARRRETPCTHKEQHSVTLKTENSTAAPKQQIESRLLLFS